MTEAKKAASKEEKRTKPVNKSDSIDGDEKINKNIKV